MIYVYVGIGGVAGSLLRFGISSLVGAFTVGEYPIGTLIINLSGSFLLGWISARYVKPKIIKPEVAGLITSGLIGSYTTFSTFSVETVKLMNNGNWLFALSYVVCSLVGGLMLVRWGLLTGEAGSRNEKNAV
ncbi:MAG: fluoride efflux transporter CrcB [Bacillota bacterium]|nr:fluoride efflux transporter CrcB [Bacillota bacterium]MDP4170076.1 fluoride efflux transporter CrcB [Bacillota bacterium]